MIRLLIVDDHSLFVAGIRGLLEQAKDIEVVATACDCVSGVAAALEHHPDVVLMDMTMPGGGGVECTKRILNRLPDTKTLALSMHDDRRFIVEMLRSGACGYLLKECTAEELVYAIRTVADGKWFLSSRVCLVIIQDYLKLLDEAQGSSVTPLSEREQDVLKLLVQGCNSKQIATELSISKNTVDTHRRRIMDKLNCDSIAELTRYAIREGLLDLS